MPSFHRSKTLHKSTKIINKPCNSHPCQHFYTILPPDPLPLPLPPPSPPPPPPLSRPRQTSTSQSLTPFLILMFCGLAVSFVFIWYLACTTRYRRRRRVHELTGREPYEGFVNEDLGPVMHYPIWLIDTAGLDPLQIESIDVFKYKRDEKMIEGTDCSVCLSEFEEDDTLRLLPKCSHAFHVPCIDTWLRSHKNCPLCRAPIVNDTNDRTESNSVERWSTSEDRTQAQADESEFIDDGHVVEVDHNIREIGKTSCNDHLGDHHHVESEELVTMRRSVSIGQLVESKKPNNAQTSETKLNGSSSSVNVGHKVMKSYSLARSLRKARSFTSSYRTHDRSY